MIVQVYSKFRKNKIWKKVKSPIFMTNGRFNTSKCRGMLQKMGVMYIHSPKALAHSPNFQKKSKKKIAKNWESRSQSGPVPRPTSAHSPPASSGPPIAGRRSPGPFFCALPSLKKTLAPLFGHMWSTLFHWLQHMSTLPRLLLKTSNNHNFLSVAPKIMKFVLTRSLLQDAFG
jgi:hypothetical protein